MHYTRVDVILWVFLQNILLLPNDYLIETEEYDTFINAEINAHAYILSCKHIKYEMNYEIYKQCITTSKTASGCDDIYFNSFQNMLSSLHSVLDDDSYKKNLITRTAPLIKMLFIEDQLHNLRL